MCSQFPTAAGAVYVLILLPDPSSPHADCRPVEKDGAGLWLSTLTNVWHAILRMDILCVSYSCTGCPYVFCAVSVCARAHNLAKVLFSSLAICLTTHHAIFLQYPGYRSIIRVHCLRHRLCLLYLCSTLNVAA